MNKKICYFTIWREDSETVGINMKIKNQVKAFAKLGLESYFCTSSNNYVRLYRFDNISNELKLVREKVLSEKAKYCTEKSTINRKISSSYRLNECLNFLEEMTENYGFNMIYIRRIMPITRKLAYLIKEFSNKEIKVVWEIPTWGSNPKTPYWMLLHLQEEYMYKRLRRSISKIVAICSDNIEKDNILFINNGVDNESIPKRKPATHESINLVCLATFSYWHGYDRLLKGLKEYYDRNKKFFTTVNIYMVGNGKTQELIDLAKEYNIEKYVFFKGVVVGNELNELFNNMDIAIGNLGFFRQGVYSDTSIKIREYCSRGIPFVTALNVNDFPEDFPYILKVPMDESSIDITKIIEFYKNLSNESVLKDMREYALQNLSWETQLKKVLDSISM
ncbi:hypothetical protein [Paraclostridium sordellii]|uniref:hypothetical protein n=1 Tax=Paraclostridium sordellii TaxID=1505 RepID=UPI00189A75CD|nr:hypothetical protein [Paeniclostridium sordellii]